MIVDPPTSGKLIAVQPGQQDYSPKPNEKTVTIFSTQDLDERRIKVSKNLFLFYVLLPNIFTQAR